MRTVEYIIDSYDLRIQEKLQSYFQERELQELAYAGGKPCVVYIVI